MNSPFTSFIETSTDELNNGILNTEEFESIGPFVNNAVNEESGDFNDELGYELLPESEISGTDLARAISWNKKYIDDYGWRPYGPLMLPFLNTDPATFPDIKNDFDVFMRAFTIAFANWQEKNGFNTSYKGVFGINNWTYFQKKLGFHNLSNGHSINITKAISDNKYYERKTWKSKKADIYKALAGYKVVNIPLPLSDEYFAYAIADFQALKGLAVDGILGPNTFKAININPGIVLSDSPANSLTTDWGSIIEGATLCKATPLMDGYQAFQVISDTIKSTKQGDFIYILGWMIDVNFELLKGDDTTTMYALLRSADSRGVEIRVLIWPNLFYIDSINDAYVKINALKNARMFKDTATVGSNNLDDTIIKLRAYVNSIPFPYNLALKNFSKWRKIEAVSNLSNEGSHHEKLMVIKTGDSLTGFCGGMDINKDRFNDLHDVHCKLEGHGAWQLHKEFSKRWMSNIDFMDIKGIAYKKNNTGINFFHEPMELQPGSGGSFVKVFHTYNDWKGKIKDRSIRDNLHKAIVNAKRIVYLQDQYMVSCEIAGWLNDKLQDKDFKVIILTQDDKYAQSDLMIAKRKRQEFIDKLMFKIPNPGNVQITQLTKGNNKYFHEKIHSKIYIIDNELAIVGSANCNRRSMFCDSETAAFIFPEKDVQYNFALDLLNLHSKYHPKSPGGDASNGGVAPYVQNPTILDLDTELTVVAKAELTAISIGAPIQTLIPTAISIINNLVAKLWEVIDPNPDKIDCPPPNIPEEELEELYNNESYNIYESSDEETETTMEPVFSENEWKDISSEISDELFTNEFYVDPAKGTTDYINVSAVLGRSLKTGIFIPAGFTASDKVNIVLYLHGLFSDGNRTNGIEYYWKNYSNIRDYFYTTRRNAILIAPTLSSNPQNEDVILNNRGGLDKFLTACLKAIQAKGYLPASSDFNSIIIAAHSAGGRPLARILGYPGVYKERIIECWGLDCLYATWWAENINHWASGDKKFYHYWAWSCSAKNLGSCPRVIGDKFTANPNFQNIAPIGKIAHQQVIENAWLYPILNRPWFDKIGFGLMEPEEGLGEYSFESDMHLYEDPVYINSNEDLVTDMSRAVRLNDYYAGTLGWDKYHDKINDFLLPFSGQVNVSLGAEAFAQALSAWQSQQGFSSKDSDGILGPTTWGMIKNIILSATATAPGPTPIITSPGTGSFTFSKYSLSSNPIVIRERDDRKKHAEVREAPAVFLKAIVRNAGEDPQKWFDRFTKVTFLGRSLKGDQYVQENLAIHLKQLELKLAIQYGGPAADPTIAGDNLMLTHEGFSGSRLVSSTATYSYHMFGLAVDINYNGCPYIQSHDAFNTWMGKVANLVANTAIQGINWGLGTNSTTAQYLKLYDDYAVLNNYLKEYFSLLDIQNESTLISLIAQCSYNPWKSFSVSQAKSLIQKDLTEISKAWKGSRSNPEDIFKNGFLGVSREFVKVMVESGLDWGGRYGDIMHFDMRRAAGVGAKIESAKLQYMSAIEHRSRDLYGQSEQEDRWNSYESGYTDELVPDMSKAVRLNSYYSQSLGWYQYHDKINDFLLPFSGQQNVSLGEEDFTEAVSAWQKSIGMPAKDCDGIIGPKTWSILKSTLFQTSTAGGTSSTAVVVGTYSLETVPLSFSTDHVPTGFKPGRYGSWTGLDRKPSIRVDEAAKKINATIPLNQYGITETDIDTFQRLADAETNGKIQDFYSYDDAIISMGFRQFTFIHGNITEWISKAPAAFKRYGIEIDSSSADYKISRSSDTYFVKKIKGVTDPETLRWNGWAQRFYYAGLDYEIIIAEFVMAKEYFAKELKTLQGRLSLQPALFAKFMTYYNQSAHVRAIYHELCNAGSSVGPKYTATAVQKINSETVEEFLELYLKTILANWPDHGNPQRMSEKIQRIFNNTQGGARIKVFDNEFNYDVYEDDNRAYEIEENLYDSLVTNWANAVNQNQYYANKLGWGQFYDKINDLLLPFSGQQNVSLGEEAFAQATAAWQQQQGFSASQSDGIIGPHTWSIMQQILNAASPQQPATPAPGGPAAPPMQNIFSFNQWHAQKILDSINAGIVGVNAYLKFNPKDQLEKIVKGQRVLQVDPNNAVIKILPVIYQVCEQAKLNNYLKIIIGSFIRDADANGNCTGHCAGRCIDLNYAGGNWELPGPDTMVKNILTWLLPLNARQNQHFGFGMPLQGTFFGHHNYTKFRSQPASNIIDPSISNLVRQLGIVFPDNNNHLHIQVS